MNEPTPPKRLRVRYSFTFVQIELLDVMAFVSKQSATQLMIHKQLSAANPPQSSILNAFTTAQTEFLQKSAAPFCQILNHRSLDIFLEFEQIHLLPVAAVQRQHVPVATGLSASTECHNIHERKDPEGAE